MSTVNELLSHFSLEEIFIFVILIFMVAKVMGELFDYFYKKLKNYFGQKDEAEDRLRKIESRLGALEDSTNAHFEELKNAQLKRDAQVQDIQKQTSDIIQRMQESEKFCLLEKIQTYEQEGRISTFSLQYLLNRYENYIAYGNEDAFLAQRVEDVQKLPRK